MEQFNCRESSGNNFTERCI